MFSSPRIERHQLPVVIAEEDYAARRRHRAGPHRGGSRHRVFPAALTGFRIERPQIEFALLGGNTLAAAAGEAAHRRGFFR